MAKFIRLHETSKTEVLVNVEQIVYIRDNQTDAALKGNANWRWTTILLTFGNIRVVETEKEIMNLIINNIYEDKSNY